MVFSSSWKARTVALDTRTDDALSCQNAWIKTPPDSTSKRVVENPFNVKGAHGRTRNPHRGRPLLLSTTLQKCAVVPRVKKKKKKKLTTLSSLVSVQNALHWVPVKPYDRHLMLFSCHM